MSTYKIFVDSASDITAEQMEKYNIGLIPIKVIFDDTPYDALKDISTETFYDMLAKSSEPPKTSQPSFDIMKDTFEKALKEYDDVIFFAMSSAASGTYSTANLVRDMIDEEGGDVSRLHLFDTLNFSGFISVTAMYTADLLQKGTDVDTALNMARTYLESWDVFFLVDTLEYLEKGGRINKASFIIGSLLDIKPVLTIRNGLVENIDKIRGTKKLYEKYVSLVEKSPNYERDNSDFMLFDANAGEIKQTVKALLKERLGVEKYLVDSSLGPVIGTHTGPGTIAVFVRKK